MRIQYTSADLTEHQTQACVMEWADGQLARHPELRMLYAIPNGGARNAFGFLQTRRKKPSPNLTPFSAGAETE